MYFHLVQDNLNNLIIKISLPCRTRVSIRYKKNNFHSGERMLNVFRFYVKFTRSIRKEKLSNSLSTNGLVTGECKS